MAKEMKPETTFEESFALLDIRLGKVLEVEDEPSALKPSYRLKIDFGKFGVKQSVARLVGHPKEELIGLQILAVINFPVKQVGDVPSEVLVLGVQQRGRDSGEATPITILGDAKIGSKLS